VRAEDLVPQAFHDADQEDSEPMEYDLGNLCAFSLQSIDPAAVKKSREAHLLELAVSGTQQLIRQLFQLPAQPSDAGPLVRVSTVVSVQHLCAP
jgi:hypothetical protein